MTEPRILTDDELRQIGALQVTPGSWWPSRHNGPNDVDRGKIWGFRAGPPPVQMVVVAEINRFIGTAEDQQLIAAAPDLRRTALYLLQRAERAEARVTELEAPGECQSLHKLRAEVARLEAELAKPVAGPWEDEGPGLVRGGHGKLAASLWPTRWNVYSPETGDPAASGSEAGEEGRRLADAAAVAAGWRLCDRA